MVDEKTIRKAAQETASEIAGRPISDRQRLISSGLIDSLSILKLISNLEKRLHIEIPAQGLQPDDFDDIQIITETVQRVARPVSD